MYSLRSMWDRYLGSLWSSMVGIVPHPHWLKTVQNSLLGIRMLKVHCVVVIWNKKWRKKNTTAQRLFLGYVSLDYKHQWLIYQAFGQTHISTGDPVGAKNKQTSKENKRKDSNQFNSDRKYRIANAPIPLLLNEQRTPHGIRLFKCEKAWCLCSQLDRGPKTS